MKFRQNPSSLTGYGIKVLFSDIRTIIAMKLSWSLASSTLSQLIEEARFCEAAGLDGVWFPDYQAPFAEWPELYVVLTSVALNTNKLFIGSMITDVLRRHPMVTAHAFASLSQLAPARLILGLGAGAGTSHFSYGIKLNHLVRRLKEGIKVIRALWESVPEKPSYFKGEHFSLEKAGSPLKPLSDIPIYVASYGPKMIEITAKLADGWIPESHTPETYRVTLEKIFTIMNKCERKMEEFEPCLAVIYYPFEPDEEAYKRILDQAKLYLTLYPDIQWSAGFGTHHPGLRTHQLLLKPQLLDKLIKKVPDKFADSTIVYGEVDDCLDRIASFWEAGCRHIIFEPYWIEKEKIRKAIKIAGRKIKPRIADFNDSPARS
jgi:phthiodiolone/phenolphthiodiolone dimycocerosates ketoreductase